MANMTRWAPFDEAMSLRDAVNRLFEDSFVAPQGPSGSMGMETDIHENEDAYLIEATVPGLQAEDIDITLHDNVLTISGEYQKKEQREGTTTHRTERRYGRFTRSFSLPATLDADNVQANLENGILTLTVPKAEAAKPRKIDIHASQRGERTLEAGK